MKKLCILTAGAICVTLLSGCGNNGKKLVCDYAVSEDSSARMEYTINFDKSGDKVLSYTQSAIMDYGDTLTEEEFQSTYETAQESCDVYADMKGTKCSVSKDKTEIRYDLEVVLSNLDDDSKEKLYISEIENKNYDDFKTYMEDSSFTCK